MKNQSLEWLMTDVLSTDYAVIYEPEAPVYAYNDWAQDMESARNQPIGELA